MFLGTATLVGNLVVCSRRMQWNSINNLGYTGIKRVFVIILFWLNFLPLERGLSPIYWRHRSDIGMFQVRSYCGAY